VDASAFHSAAPPNYPILQIPRSLEHARIVGFGEALDYLAAHTSAQEFSSRLEILAALVLGDPIHTPQFIFLRPLPSWRGQGGGR
jgi:hypothetical protein